MNELDTFVLKSDLNPIIKSGMTGVILLILEKNVYEVGFVKEDGRNYEFNGEFTFTVKADQIEKYI